MTKKVESPQQTMYNYELPFRINDIVEIIPLEQTPGLLTAIVIQGSDLDFHTWYQVRYFINGQSQTESFLAHELEAR